MSEPKTMTALYDPGRGPGGKFTKGNKASVSWSSETAMKFRAAQMAWHDSVTPQDMTEVAAELKWLCLQRDDLQTKQKAIVYYLDRQLGRPTERVELSAGESQPAPVVDLQPDEIAALERLVARTGDALVLPE